MFVGKWQSELEKWVEKIDVKIILVQTFKIPPITLTRSVWIWFGRETLKAYHFFPQLFAHLKPTGNKNDKDMETFHQQQLVL